MSMQGIDELRAVITSAGALTMERPANADWLLDHLRSLYRELFAADFTRYDVAEVQRIAPELVAELFDLKLEIRDRIAEWAAAGLMSRPVQSALRDLFRVMRYASDLVGEIGRGHPRLARRAHTAAGFGGDASFLSVNRRFGEAMPMLEAGDLVLQRGMLHNSAAIARIGDVDSQFSHVGMICRDGAGTLVMVESVIEDGAIVGAVETALNHGLGRAILFRHKDRALAALAAEMIHAHVMRANGPQGARILYDFTMAQRNYQTMFCAELVRLAFAMASTGRTRLPTYPTRLDMRNRDFITRIGVRTTETFAPGDLELEPDFDVVAEWRDYRVTSELRLKDMIMTKLFEWMERDGYTFKDTWWIRTIAGLGRLSSRLPDRMQNVTRKWIGKVPPNMTGEAIGAVAMLHKTGEVLFKELAVLEARSIASTGRQLHPRDVLAHLERMKAGFGPRIGYLQTS